MARQARRLSALVHRMFTASTRGVLRPPYRGRKCRPMRRLARDRASVVTTRDRVVIVLGYRDIGADGSHGITDDLPRRRPAGRVARGRGANARGHLHGLVGRRRADRGRPDGGRLERAPRRRADPRADGHEHRRERGQDIPARVRARGRVRGTRRLRGPPSLPGPASSSASSSGDTDTGRLPARRVAAPAAGPAAARGVVDLADADRPAGCAPAARRRRR